MAATFWVAEYESRSFDFLAVDDTQAGARESLRSGLVRHADAYGLDRDWFDIEDANVYAVPAGECLRDGSVIR